MKILYLVFTIWIVLTSASAFCQSIRTVNEIVISSPPTSSYYVNKEGRILAGVSIRADRNFFLKVNRNFHNAPSPLKHFIKTEYFNPTTLSLPKPSYLPVKTTYEYFDGLGNLLQTVDAEASPSKKDVIGFVARDEFNRETRRYLPYTAQGKGMFRNDAITEQKEFYETTSNVPVEKEPWMENRFEQSSRARVRENWSAGWDWHSQDVSSKTNFKLNAVNEVLKIDLSADGLISFSNTFWTQHTLTIDESIDEGGLSVKSYRDFRGQLILVRKGKEAEWLDTYYVYDAAGMQRSVISPEGVKRLQTNGAPADVKKFLDEYCFQFFYDQHGRMIRKVWPGGVKTEFVYDRWDRLVYSQDSNQSLKSEWSYTKYDEHNRPIITGIISGQRATLEKELANATHRFEERQNGVIGYGNRCYPGHTDRNILAVNYYDCYSFINYRNWDEEGNSFAPTAVSGIVAIDDLLYSLDASKVYNPVVRGYRTGTKMKVVGTTTTKWLNEVVFYNKEYRIVQAIRENFAGGRDVVSMSFDVRTGQVLKSHLAHAGFNESRTVVQEFSYDAGDRLVQVTSQVNSEPKVTLLKNKYNELGQVIEKNLHSTDGTNFLQSLDFRYSIQGWPTHLNNASLTNDGKNNDDTNDLFGMEITYNQDVSIDNRFTGPSNHDGNVAGIRWKTNTLSRVNPPEQIFAFKYDDFKRFQESYYAARTTSSWAVNPGMYNEAVPYYDANGNIGGGPTPGLTRYGPVNGQRTLIDNLIYRYEGNRLKNVNDLGSKSSGFPDIALDASIDEFDYDANGNMTVDMNKSISRIVYNHLNLPQEITVTRPPAFVEEKVKFVYDATGKRLQKEITVGGKTLWTTTYADGVQYDNGQFTAMEMPEGRVVFDGNAHEYEYFIRDVHNNVRVVCALRKEAKVYKATMELSLDSHERSSLGFTNITETRSTGNNITLPTPQVSTPDRSARCNGFGDASYPSRPIGPGKMLRVTSGEAIYAEVFARYNGVVANGNLITATLLGSYLTSSFSITSTENNALWNQMNGRAGMIGSTLPNRTGVPKAYLALQFYDENNQFVRSAASSISERAFGQFEKLTISFAPEKSGFVYIYVVNESNEGRALDVFFDDLTVIHQGNNVGPQVVQAFDYYPFGLPFNVYEGERLKVVSTSPLAYEPVLRNRKMFQNQEYLKDFNLNFFEYRYRFHDPALGRFTSLDPLAEDFMHNSPFAFSENFLMNAVELEGREADMIWKVAKMISPVAIRVDYALTSHETSFGFDVSIGLPKILPISYRKEFGATFNSYDILEKKSVMERRSAQETSGFFGIVSFQSTSYKTANTSQTTGMFTFGAPFANIVYENDWQPEEAMQVVDPVGMHSSTGGDGGDRFRTAALRTNMGFTSLGFNLATGDPGEEGKRKTQTLPCSLKEAYQAVMKDGIFYDPNKYRLGLAYISNGPLRIGLDNEQIRHGIQNRFAHDTLMPIITSKPIPWFEVMPSNNQLYFGFITGSSSLW